MGAWGVVIGYAFGLTSEVNIDSFALIGDSLNTITALFTSATLAYVIYTGMKQQEAAERMEELQNDQVQTAAFSAYTQCLASLTDNLSTRTHRAIANWRFYDHTLYTTASSIKSQDDLNLLKRERDKWDAKAKKLGEEAQIVRTELETALATLKANRHVTMILESHTPTEQNKPPSSASSIEGRFPAVDEVDE